MHKFIDITDTVGWNVRLVLGLVCFWIIIIFIRSVTVNRDAYAVLFPSRSSSVLRMTLQSRVHCMAARVHWSRTCRMYWQFSSRPSNL